MANWPHPQIGTTHWLEPPTDWNHPLIGTTHWLTTPTDWPHPLTDHTHWLATPTDWPHPLIGTTHWLATPTDYVNGVIHSQNQLIEDHINMIVDYRNITNKKSVNQCTVSITLTLMRAYNSCWYPLQTDAQINRKATSHLYRNESQEPYGMPKQRVCVLEFQAFDYNDNLLWTTTHTQTHMCLCYMNNDYYNITRFS
jgi:hypothetical protein